MESKWQRLLLFLAVAVTAICVLVPLASAEPGQGVPPRSAFYAASANWAAKAKLLDVTGQPRLHVCAPTAAITASSANWAAKAKLLDINGQPRPGTFASTSAMQAASANWAAKAKLLDETGQPFRTTVGSSQPGTGFDWGDYGIGAVAMLGLLLVGVGVVARAHLKAGSPAASQPDSGLRTRDTARAASGAAKTVRQ